MKELMTHDDSVENTNYENCRDRNVDVNPGN